MREYRFVITVDFDAESLDDAYDALCTLLQYTVWESTDEFFVDGEQGAEAQMVDARMRRFKRNNP